MDKKVRTKSFLEWKQKRTGKHRYDSAKRENIMKNPKVNRMVGYLILFVGMGLFYKGFHNDIVFYVIISIILLIGSIAWMILKVRCPHCNALLNLKLGNIDCCPYCGKNTDV